jgi:subtilisin family serine protease
MKLRSAFSMIAALGIALSSTSAIAVSAAPAASGATQISSTTGSQNYLVVYSGLAVPSGAASMIKKAGGSVVYSYGAIGVVLATSSSSTFASNMMKNGGVLGVDSTGSFGTQVNDEVLSDDSSANAPLVTPAPGTDNLSGLQWDMVQIHAFEAHDISGGSPSVVVGDIDTGMDYTHPDLAPNVDFADSVSCVGGVPNPDPAAWLDDNGHGTHTAGTIAAAKNGVGIVGVAPNVKIAAIKAGNAAGFFFPEAVICSFLWAGSHHINVTNNSYFADPWLFNCRNDAVQRAIWTAERRAIQYAISKGVVVVAADGNQADDLAHPTADATSPDDSSPVLRQIHNDCATVPVEVPGVIGVSADGNLALKSFYSSYGMAETQVTAPGGDSRLQRTAAAPNGAVLSTWPTYFSATVKDCSVSPCATYRYAQGTSMASPHAAGVAALLISRGVAPRAVAAMMQNTADPMSCPPDMSIYDPYPAVDNGAPQVCTGGSGHTSFYGAGQINALTAVSAP